VKMANVKFEEILKTDAEIVEMIAEGLPYREIAARLGSSRDAVKLKVRRLKRRFSRYKRYVETLEKIAEKNSKIAGMLGV